MAKSQLTKAKNKAWAEFSKFIRTRDNGTCITCGRSGFSGSGYHAGHFIPQAAGGNALRYHEENVHGQCYNCNINLGGWGERYAEVMEHRYGRKFVDGLRLLKYEVKKYTVEDYEAIASAYKKKLQELQLQKVR